MIPVDRPDTDERRLRIKQMIEEYRRAQQRRFLRLAVKLWGKTESHQWLVEQEAKPERVH